MIARLLAAAFLLGGQETESFFPAKEGTSRTFCTGAGTYGGAEVVWKFEKVGKRDFKLIDAGVEDIREMKWAQAKAEADDLVIQEGDKARFIVRKTKDEIRVYQFEHAYLLSYVFPKELKDGMKWKAPQVFLSCGFGVIECSYAAVAEKVTVSAGTFDAVRVDIENAHGMKESIWFARGRGIVKWKSNLGTLELSA